eukprot:TRINITY_DN937_c0_g3_i3.p1 TRINITY_DN937_c0_g3~~TRINITY_DN937_c0_g3_i3.p1  ORF type:complete len:268 (-),score=55.56 TRINITY_DN937_c0_g3_i3:230-1033(-)
MSTSAPRTNPRAVRSQSAERSAPMRPTNALSAAKTPSQTQTNVAKTTLTRPSSASRVRPPQTKEPTTSDPSRQPKLSAIRFDSHKAANPFSTQKKHKTNFGVVYSQGGIPCRINHGGVHHKLQWDRPIQSIDYNPIFVTFAEGLLESEHPYCFVARAGFKEMCQVEDAQARITPLVSRVVPPIRMALMSREKGVFETGMEAISMLSQVVGPALNEHLGVLLVPISKKIFEKDSKESVLNLLQELEQNGGPDALRIIKSKVPTYVSVS